MKSYLFLVLFVTFLTGHGLKILGVFPHNGKSHFEMYRPLLKALAKKGHQMTVLNYFPQEEKMKNYEDITFTSADPMIHAIDFDIIYDSWLARQLSAYLINYFARATCEDLKSKTFQDFLNSEREFDVIIVELFNSNCFYAPIVKKFKAPLIGISSHLLMPWVNRWVGNPDNPSYIPNIFQGSSDRMNFWSRVDNFFGYLHYNLYNKFVMDVQDRTFAQEALGEIYDVQSTMRNLSLILLCTHFTSARPRPLLPNIVEVGGIHIGENKPLPKDLEEWIAESPEGVIYFSMGSMIKGHTFPEEQKNEFLKAFARLPQRVLWKYENDTLPGKPPNVMIQKWTPQFDVLCHPNVKAFVSHGGNLGLTETVHCGTPAIVMPQYGDQFTNAASLAESGGAIVMNLKTATEGTVLKNLKTILDPGFQRQAKELSRKFKDRPLPPIETAIYWVEYVARYKGATHMRSAAADMPLYQYLLLDVIAFYLLCLAVICYSLGKCYRNLFSKTPKKKIKKH